ncbi:formin-like protein 3 [Trachypithecus francoisi]|uniref:formin-like protein 3 n=1 Tax=Trachypithecus francoisi TaxID=54180 RepID=UPI00141B3421|nr:formin-like protein 3 [Trachypithecus francoisi]
MMCCCLVNHSSRHSLAERSAATSSSSSSRSSRSGSCSLQPPPPPQPPPRRWGNFSTLCDGLPYRPQGQVPLVRPPRPRPCSQPEPLRLGKFIPPALLPFLLLFTPPPALPRLFPPGGCRCRRCRCQPAPRPAAPAPGLGSPQPHAPLRCSRRSRSRRRSGPALGPRLPAPQSSGLPRRLHRPAPPRAAPRRADLQRPAASHSASPGSAPGRGGTRGERRSPAAPAGAGRTEGGAWSIVKPHTAKVKAAGELIIPGTPLLLPEYPSDQSERNPERGHAA